MGVSFKVANPGTRYRPKVFQVEDKEIDNDPTTESQQRGNEGDLVGFGDKVTDYSTALVKPGLRLVSEAAPEVSFSLNLFPSGFSVGKPNQLFNNVPKRLHPYDRASEILFCAIESGCLPGDIFDDLPCKYVNGALLCAIRDYRNILSQKGETASSMENSPVIYKKVLHMCMENVVKDISLVSDDSWTYNDLLEFESRILKALRPDLHLDPKPMLDRFCEEPKSEKLNLGISWNRKKRRLNDVSTIDQVFSNQSPRFQVSEVCAARNSNFQSDVEFQDRVPYSQQLVPSSTIAPQRNYILEENMSQSSLLTSQANYQLAVTYSQSLSGALTPSNAVCAPKPNYGHSDPRLPSSLTLGERRRYGTLANQGPISKKPKQEPLDFSQEQLPQSQAETKLATEIQWKNKIVHQEVEAERILHERTYEKMHPSSSRKNVQQEILEGIPKSQPEVPTFRVKEEPIELSSFPCLNAGNAKDNSHIMDMRNGQSNLLQSQLVKSSVPANAMQRSHISQSIGKNITNEVVTQGQRGKALQHSLVSSGDVNVSVHSHLGNSLPGGAPLLTKRKSNSLPKGSKHKAETLAGTSAMNTANSVCLPVEIPLPWPSVIDDTVLETPVLSGISDPVLERLSKMKMVTQRYAVNNRKHKFSQVFFQRKSFSCTTQLVGFQLMNSEDKNFEDGNTDTIYHSECSWENYRNIFKTRKFTFVRSSHVSQGNDIANSKAQNKLTILEKLDKGIVEATVVYNHEKFDPIELRLLETFTNTHHADLFAAQFSSLMMREGYCLAVDSIEPATRIIDESSTSQQQTVTSTATPAAELVEPTPIPGQSPYMFNPINSSVSASNPRQLTSHNNFSGGQLLPSANFNSALPLSAGYLSNPPTEIASQLSEIHPQWQHIMNKRAFSELQMLQRYRLQQHLLQKRAMMGGFGAAASCPGTMHLGGGVQGLGNIGLGPFGNVLGMGGSAPLLRGGNIQGIGSTGENNTQDAVLGTIRIAENGGRALMCGFSMDGSAGVAPTCQTNTPGVAYHAINRQPPSKQMQYQFYTQQHQEMRSPLQPPEATRWTEHVGLPLSPSSLIQMVQQSRMSPQQISSVSVPHPMDSGNSCSTSSSMELHGLIEGGSAIQTGGVK